MEVSSQLHDPSTLSLGKVHPYTLNITLGRHCSLSGWSGKEPCTHLTVSWVSTRASQGNLAKNPHSHLTVGWVDTRVSLVDLAKKPLQPKNSTLGRHHSWTGWLDRKPPVAIELGKHKSWFRWYGKQTSILYLPEIKCLDIQTTAWSIHKHSC